MRKQTKKRISRTLRFTEVTNRDGAFVGGGIGNTIEHIDEEVWVQIFRNCGSDPPYAEPLHPERIQLHLGGTRRAFEELGVFLIALSKYTPHRTDYSISFDLNDSEDRPAMNLVVHLPVEQSRERIGFQKIHAVATAIISEDGKQILETTVNQRPRSKKKKSGG